jgi:hypothetical protein
MLTLDTYSHVLPDLQGGGRRTSCRHACPSSLTAAGHDSTMVRRTAPDPRAHRALVGAMDQYVRSRGALLEHVPPPTSLLGLVPVAVSARLISSCVAAVRLFRDGYTRDAEILMRSVVGSAISFAALVQEGTDARSYLFLAHGLRLAQRQAKHHEMSSDMDVEEQFAVEVLIRERWGDPLVHVRPDPEPRMLGNNKFTWSGLDDAALADLVGARVLYRHAFTYLSNATHGSTPVIMKVLIDRSQAGAFTLGPDYSDGLILSRALGDALDLWADRLRARYPLVHHETEGDPSGELERARHAYAEALGLDVALKETQQAVNATMVRTRQMLLDALRRRVSELQQREGEADSEG